MAVVTVPSKSPTLLSETRKDNEVAFLLNKKFIEANENDQNRTRNR